MFHSVSIRYPVDEMEKSRKRLESASRFQWFDRAPVLLGIEARYLLEGRGVTFAEYFSDPKTQFIHQLENLKWRIENIPDDWFTDRALTIAPDFQNVTNANGCGCDIYWQERETPQAVQRLSTVDAMVAHRLPDWRQTLWGKKLEWYHEMQRLAAATRVTLNGEDIPVRVTLGINADSPFMSAVDLAGPNFYEWLLGAPGECTTFLGILTERYIEVETELRRVAGRAINAGLVYSDDSAQIISREQYRDFCVPYAQRLFRMFGNDHYDGRAMHLCGRNVHLHELLLRDLRITMLTGYGSGNAPEEMGVLAGNVVLHGNVDPMTLFEGSAHQVEEETTNILEVLGPRGGVILGDGFNIVPSSPLANLAAIREASQRYGVPFTNRAA